MYSFSISKLIDSFKKLPSVGQHTAERFAFHLLKSGKKEVTELMLALKNLVDKVQSCKICWNFSDQNPCHICANPKRDHSLICVVAEAPDLLAIEKTGEYRGIYHVSRGLIDPSEEDSLQKIKIKELLKRVTANRAAIKEIILALNPNLAGETTMLYLEKQIRKINSRLKITRLARGLPLGSDLNYADEITLSSAIKNRVIKM